MAIARYKVHSFFLDQKPMASAITRSIPWNFEYPRIAVAIPRIIAFVVVEADTHFLKEWMTKKPDKTINVSGSAPPNNKWTPGMNNNLPKSCSLAIIANHIVANKKGILSVEEFVKLVIQPMSGGWSKYPKDICLPQLK